MRRLHTPAAGSAHRASARRSSATSSRGTRCSAAPSGTRPASTGPRASATRTSPRRRGRSCPARFDVLADIVYHWRIRDDGSSITQQRSSRPRPRATAGRPSGWRSPTSAPRVTRAVEAVFVDRVLAGDLWRYFLEIPGCSDEWWALLRDGVREIWGAAVAGAQRAAARAPAVRLAGRAGPARGRRRDGVRRASTGPCRRSGDAWPDTGDRTVGRRRRRPGRRIDAARPRACSTGRRSATADRRRPRLDVLRDERDPRSVRAGPPRLEEVAWRRPRASRGRRRPGR